jgi:hypothetical protein
MQKISENLDLSKKVLEIDIKSEIFNCMMQDINEEIQRCVRDVFDEKFESGEISLKLSIKIPNAFEIIPRTDELTGELVNDTYRYRRPDFEHNITTTLKKQYKQEGSYTDRRDVQFEDGKFIAVPIKQAQISMFEG